MELKRFNVELHGLYSPITEETAASQTTLRPPSRAETNPLLQDHKAIIVVIPVDEHLEPNTNTRLRDFLLLYNKLTEQCFERCISDLKTKIVSTKEQSCVTVCTDRYVGFNQKTMFVFMEHQKLREAAQLKEYELAAQKAAAAESSPTPETLAQPTTS